jgi:hypothetical protein
MGRPPIGKRAMTALERLHRHRAKLRANKPATKRETKHDDGALARANKRIAELEAKLARRANSPTPNLSRTDGTPRPATTDGGNVGKLIRMLGSPNDREALTAARKLAKATDLHALAEAWERAREQENKHRPAKPKPVDWPKVDEAVQRYADGKTTVMYRNLWKAVVKEVPALDENRTLRECHDYISRCMGQLGFTMSSSGLAFSRSETA